MSLKPNSASYETVLNKIKLNLTTAKANSEHRHQMLATSGDATARKNLRHNLQRQKLTLSSSRNIDVENVLSSTKEHVFAQ